MQTIQEIQSEIIRDFNEIGDGFDQYSYLATLSFQLPSLPEEKKTKERLVEGCQSRVWLDMERRDGRFYLAADSDTMIIRGILKLLTDLLSGQPLTDVAQAEITFLKETAIMESFALSRQKGIGYIIGAIRAAAGG